MFERGGETVSLVGIVPQPVQELGEAPLGRVDAAAPVDRCQAARVGCGCDLGGLFPCAVVAPEVVIVDGLEVLVDRNDAGAGGVEGDRFDGRAVDFCVRDGAMRCFGERGHVIGVALGGVVGVVRLAEQRVFGDAGAEPSFGAVEEGDAYAEGAEVDASYDAHGLLNPL